MVVRVGFMVDQMILGLISFLVCSNVVIIPPVTIRDIRTIRGRVTVSHPPQKVRY